MPAMLLSVVLTERPSKCSQSKGAGLCGWPAGPLSGAGTPGDGAESEGRGGKLGWSGGEGSEGAGGG